MAGEAHSGKRANPVTLIPDLAVILPTRPAFPFPEMLLRAQPWAIFDPSLSNVNSLLKKTY